MNILYLQLFTIYRVDGLFQLKGYQIANDTGCVLQKILLILAFSFNLDILRAQQQQYFQTDKDSNYNYGFLVDDGESGVQFNQQEQRQQNRTEGSYSVRLPDTRLMKVAYFVDGNSGYVAEISYEGEAQFPEDAGYGKESGGNSPNFPNSPQFISQGGNQPSLQSAALQQGPQFQRQLNNFPQESQVGNFATDNFPGQFGGFSQSQRQQRSFPSVNPPFQQESFLVGNSQQQQSEFSVQRQQRGVLPSLTESSEDQTREATHEIYKSNVPTVIHEKNKEPEIITRKLPTTITQGIRDFALEEFIAASQKIPQNSHLSVPAESRSYSKNILKPSQFLKLA